VNWDVVPVQPILEQVVAAFHAGLRIDRQLGRRKHPEPALTRTGILALQSMGQIHTVAPTGTILAPESSRMGQLRLQAQQQRLGQHHYPVFVAFSAAHHDRVAIKSHVPDPQCQGFAKAQPTAIQQGSQ
jgi:hypothetical protein